ncbi:MAG TPA: PfkB family carbohydrate kinase [Alphaproteobacteria bacterium]|nr:PfkB family carbohydrate kinase [Alphaproteobacteria bacterium]
MTPYIDASLDADPSWLALERITEYAAVLADVRWAVASHIVFSRAGLVRFSGVDDVSAALHAVASRFTAFVTVTLGAEGCAWRSGRAIHRYSAPRVAVVDTFGAGDAFHDAFALAIAEGMPVEDTLAFANAAAALKCARFGGIAGAPTRGEVYALTAKTKETS